MLIEFALYRFILQEDKLRQTIASRSFKILLYHKKTYFIVVSSLLLILIVFFSFIHRESLVVFPSKERSSFIAYSDHNDGGNSVIDRLIITDSSLTVKYTIQKGFISPHIGIVNRFEENVSMYNRLHIEIDGKGTDNLFVYLITYDKNVKDTTHRLANRHSDVNLQLKKDQYKYNIPLENFSTPTWWYQVLNQSGGDFGPIELNKLRGISITTGISPVLGQAQEFTVKSIYFYKDYSAFSFIAIICEISLLLSLYLYHFFRLKGVSKPLEVVYKPTSPEESSKTESNFLNYIHTNYYEPDLTLTKVSENSGVSERIISKTISDQYKCNFKTYVNRIRIEEAQRLLKNSNLNISEIGYKVGFNSPSAFTKVFKKMTGNSPSFYTSKANL